MQSLMKDLRSSPFKFLLSARFLHAFILSFWLASLSGWASVVLLMQLWRKFLRSSPFRPFLSARSLQAFNLSCCEADAAPACRASAAAGGQAVNAMLIAYNNTVIARTFRDIGIIWKSFQRNGIEAMLDPESRGILSLVSQTHLAVCTARGGSPADKYQPRDRRQSTASTAESSASSRAFWSAALSFVGKTSTVTFTILPVNLLSPSL